ncbi:MAG TPA: hypothetical protein VFM56_08560 [Solimonas sp.]|nr:hypothetical protein [Solimonas sp.]
MAGNDADACDAAMSMISGQRHDAKFTRVDDGIFHKWPDLNIDSGYRVDAAGASSLHGIAAARSRRSAQSCRMSYKSTTLLTVIAAKGNVEVVCRNRSTYVRDGFRRQAAAGAPEK